MTLVATQNGNWLHLHGTAAEITAALVTYQVSPSQVKGYTQYNVNADAYTVLCYGSFKY